MSEEPKIEAKDEREQATMISYLLEELQPKLKTKRKEALASFQQYLAKRNPVFSRENIQLLLVGTGGKAKGLFYSCGQTKTMSSKLKGSAGVALGVIGDLLDQERHPRAAPFFKTVFLELIRSKDGQTYVNMMKLDRHMEPKNGGNMLAARDIQEVLTASKMSIPTSMLKTSSSMGRMNTRPIERKVERSMTVGVGGGKGTVERTSATKKGGMFTRIKNSLARLFGSRSNKADLEKKGVLKKPLVFGRTLGELQQEGRSNQDGIPLVVIQCCEHMRKHKVVEMDGVFRVSGDQLEIQHLKKEYDFDGAVDLDKCNPHSVSGLLKLFLRQMADPLFTFERYDSFVDSARSNDFSKVTELASGLPRAHQATWEYIRDFLVEVQTHRDDNRMTCQNLAIVIAPNVLRAKVETFQKIAMDTPVTIKVLKYLLTERAKAMGAETKEDEGSVEGAVSPVKGGEGSEGDESKSIKKPQLIPLDRLKDAIGAREKIRGQAMITSSAKESDMSTHDDKESVDAKEACNFLNSLKLNQAFASPSAEPDSDGWVTFGMDGQWDSKEVVREGSSAFETGSAGGCYPNHTSWRNSPQYMLSLHPGGEGKDGEDNAGAQTEVKFTLKYVECLEDSKKPSPFGLNVFINNGPGYDKLCARKRNDRKTTGGVKTELLARGRHQMPSKGDVVVSHVFSEATHPETLAKDVTNPVSMFFNFAAGSVRPHFTVVPSTYHVGHNAKFRVEVAFRNAKDNSAPAGLFPVLTAVPSALRWHASQVEGEWLGESAGGCKNHSTHGKNPRFVLRRVATKNKKGGFSGTGYSRKCVIVLRVEVEKEMVPIGFYVQSAKKHLLAKGEFVKTPEVPCIVAMPSDPSKALYVTPCTFDKGIERKFSLICLSEGGSIVIEPYVKKKKAK